MKKALNVIKTTMICLIVALAVFMMIFTIVSVTTFNRNDRDLFGYKAYIVNSDSMAATDFAAGDLIFVKEVYVGDLVEGDIITFISQDAESYGEVVTHKIRSKAVDAQGNPGFVTYGTTTGADDAVIVTFPYVLGRYEFHLDGVGSFFNFLKTPQGYIVCIFVPFMLLILYQGINCIRLFRRYKKEQNEEIRAEKAKIEAEREEANKMMAELLELKAQLQQQQQGAPAEEPKQPAQID
ncbi:MAG: signal peptidase I [Oscillospiraceae bacterium]|nr:signal peptidase I [Oscillospiraceae bacterium]